MMKDYVAEYLLQEHRSKPFDEHFREPAETDMTAAEWHANQKRRIAHKQRRKNNA